MILGRAVALVLAVGGPVLADGAAPPALAGQGHDLFTGQTPATARFPCHRCHGRDGTGGVEGNVPDIAALSGRLEADTLSKVLTQGRGWDGRALSRLMPRYDLTPAESAALLAYLHALPEAERRGVTPRSVQVAVMADPGSDYPALLQAALRDLVPGGRLHGRKIDLVPHASLTTAAEQALVLIGPPTGQAVAQAMALGLPVLFPRQSLTGAEDASLLRGLSPSGRDIAAAIAADLRQNGLTGFAATDGLPLGLLQDLQLELGATADPRAQIVAGAGLPPAPPVQRPALAYLLPTATAQIAAWRAAGWQVRLVVDAPGLVDAMLAGTLTPEQAHARLSASLLLRALRDAGRDVTRSGLLRALDRADLSDLSLSYAAHPLTGTDKVVILPAP